MVVEGDLAVSYLKCATVEVERGLAYDDPEVDAGEGGLGFYGVEGGGGDGLVNHYDFFFS